MTFRIDGFLSSSMTGFTATLRQVPAYKQWFDFAEDLNRLGHDMLEGHETFPTDNQLLVISALFIRAHQSFQAAILLIEKGMLADARAVLRSAVEGAIALNVLANDPTFIDRLIEAHLYNQRKIANVALATQDYRAKISSEQITQMEATIKNICDQETSAGRVFGDIQWANAAAKHCRELYDLMYRSLSNDGTHTNVNAIHRFLEFHPSGELAALRVGPETTDMIDVFALACLTFLWAAEPFAQAHSLHFRERISEGRARFEKLPHEEPSNVSVTAHFGN
jgi:hypothetical protein